MTMIRVRRISNQPRNVKPRGAKLTNDSKSLYKVKSVEVTKAGSTNALKRSAEKSGSMKSRTLHAQSRCGKKDANETY